MLENWMSLFYVRPVAPHVVVNALFLYSFLGWVMECIVIRLERGVWENRGFVRLPLCIIYGFGAILGYALLRPFSANLAVLYIAGAVMATAFEYLTARLMLHFFGTLWWDYTNHRWNYKGILCLQSTLGWGVIAVLLFVGMHRVVFGIVTRIPPNVGAALAFALVCAYALDFGLSMRRAVQRANEQPAGCTHGEGRFAR